MGDTPTDTKPKDGVNKLPAYLDISEQGPETPESKKLKVLSLFLRTTAATSCRNVLPSSRTNTNHAPSPALCTTSDLGRYPHVVTLQQIRNQTYRQLSQQLVARHRQRPRRMIVRPRPPVIRIEKPGNEGHGGIFHDPRWDVGREWHALGKPSLGALVR